MLGTTSLPILLDLGNGALGMLHRYAELLEGYESLNQQTDVGANDDAVVLEGIEAFVLMVQVIADQTATRSFAQIAVVATPNVEPVRTAVTEPAGKKPLAGKATPL